MLPGFTGEFPEIPAISLKLKLEGSMTKALGLVLVLVGASSFAMAAATPEVAAGSAGSAIALLSGALLVIRGRRKK